jgi:hypothetical protein
MNKNLIYIFIVQFCYTVIFAQKVIIQPQPQQIKFFDEEIIVGTDIKIFDSGKNPIEEKAINYLKYSLINRFHNVNLGNSQDVSNDYKIDITQIQNQKHFLNMQFYRIEFDDVNKIIDVESPSQLGLLYGVVTLNALIYKSNDKIHIKKASIEDYPVYRRRLFVADPSAEDISSLFDWALQNKLETVVLASRSHPWDHISDDYLSILNEIKKWKDRFGGPSVMQSHNIYEGRDIVISNENDINSLKEVIKVSYEHGIEKLMILSDDTPPYKFGEGYILTNESDKQKFEHFEAANTYLMNELVNWFKSENMEIESFYVPGFYTYEEMHQGDMELFRDTPWEEDAFGPFYRDLKYIGENLNEETYIIWCGPYVRSREISKDDLDDWTKNLAGRVPFLWDNTIYSHHPFTSTSLLTAWSNKLPDHFEKITAGNGMFINNDACSETGVVGTITTNDYLWNPSAYSPETSLKAAVGREYGFDVSELVLKFKELELSIRKVIGERKLWYESDSLWQQIRKVRYITQKNPFYYHLNYSRMKALRLQLKASVPDPEPKKLFTEKISKLKIAREEILKSIKKINAATYDRLSKVLEPIPDLELIQ